MTIDWEQGLLRVTFLVVRSWLLSGALQEESRSVLLLDIRFLRYVFAPLSRERKHWIRGIHRVQY